MCSFPKLMLEPSHHVIKLVDCAVDLNSRHAQAGQEVLGDIFRSLTRLCTQKRDPDSGKERSSGPTWELVSLITLISYPAMDKIPTRQVR